MSELPEGWIRTSLSDVGTLVSGAGFPEKLQNKKGLPYPFFKVGNLSEVESGEPLLQSNHTVDDDLARSLRAAIIPKDSIAFAKIGMAIRLNRRRLVGVPSCIDNNLMAVIPSNAVLPRYLLRYLETIEFMPLTQSTTVPALRKSDLEVLEVPIPPLNEQRRIVAKLEKLLSWVGAAQARLTNTARILKRFRQSVLAAACSGRLTADWRAQQNGDITNFSESAGEIETPDSWIWKKLPELGFLGRGKSKHRPRDAAHLYGGKYPFIQTGNIARSNGLITAHNQTYSEVGLAQSKLWEAGTVCITIAANIADSAILTYPACFPDSVVGFVADKEICLPDYVEFFIRTARKDLSQFAPATAQKNINLSILNEVMVPLPPLAEQQEIVWRVQALFKTADALEARYRMAKAHVDKLTQSILAKAFRGELVPQDPNDEPASVLLERIRQSKNKSAHKKRSGDT